MIGVITNHQNVILAYLHKKKLVGSVSPSLSIGQSVGCSGMITFEDEVSLIIYLKFNYKFNIWRITLAITDGERLPLVSKKNYYLAKQLADSLPITLLCLRWNIFFGSELKREGN